MTEDEMVGWHHQLNGHEFVQVLGDSEGLGSLASCSQSMGSQRIINGLVTEQQQVSLSVLYLHFTNFGMLYFYFLQFSLSFEFSVAFVFDS